mgnify:CR=1 FL=1|tara:strand:- start:33056 stop:33979 length:924 start_codon:yes stop_codon:yes gene_type:complete
MSHQLDKVTQRDAFWDELYLRAKDNRDIVIISADMGAPSLDKIRTDLPSQFINTGIAEQNSILVASGLAREGKTVYVYAIASFLILNCIEKIRVQNSMMEIPINLIGVGGGLSYPDSGPTHHLLEDLSIMRALPHFNIYNCSDSYMAHALVNESIESKTPNYFRLERQPNGSLYEKEQFNFKDGYTQFGKTNKSVVFTTGYMTLKVQSLIKEKNLPIDIIDVYKFPYNGDKLINDIKDYENFYSIEEHFSPGGLGSSLLETFNDKNFNKIIKRLDAGIENYCYSYGGREELQGFYNLSTSDIINHLK